MAIYHLSATPISRDKGQSSVASAAYRAAEKLYDEKLDKTFDYSHKPGVVHKEILLPDNAPAWMQERGKLWNHVEATERRKDAQLARDFNISLPRELTREQNITLAREYIQQNFVALGMIADFAIHEDKSKDGELQPHVHVMLTMRSVSPDGFGQKVRDWNSKAHLLLWRESWAETANKHLAMNDLDIRIDHRSLQVQGIALEPQYKKGAALAKVELARTQDHQRIARENGEKLIQHPEIALHAITQQQSTFTHHDLARFVNRHSTDAEQFQAIYDKVKTSPELVALGKDKQNRERYTTRDMQNLEMNMFGNVADLGSKANHPVNEVILAELMTSSTLSKEQRLALSHITQGADIASIIGFAGTGKSHMLGVARQVWEKAGYRVIGATLSGIAAESLEASSSIRSRTLASLIYAWDKHNDKLTAKHIVVIDEAGMLGTRQMSRVLQEAAQVGAKVVLVGDPEQLQAIDAGAAFRGIVERTGYIELSDIRRQRQPWQRIATKEFATRQTSTALTRYADQGHVHAFSTQDDAKKAIIADWNRDRLASPQESRIILAYTRDDVKILNELARHEKRTLGELGADISVQTDRGERNFAIGDRLYFLKNDQGMGVKNGTLGTIENIQHGKMTVRLDQKPNMPGRRVTFSTNLYNNFDHGYAATIHKSQGITINDTYLLASPYIDSHGIYVGGSRHTDRFNLYYSSELFPTEQKLMQSLSRQRDKDLVIDYGVENIHDKSFTIENCNDKIKASKQVTLQTSLEDFATRFETMYPDKAKSIQESFRSSHEKTDLNASDRSRLLEQKLVTSASLQLPKESQDLSAKLQKQSAVMDYTGQQDTGVSNKKEAPIKVKEKDYGEISL